MSRELDNANPTIYSPTSVPSSSKRQPKSARALLWNDQAGAYEYERTSPQNSDEEREEIDAEEIYGELQALVSMSHPR